MKGVFGVFQVINHLIKFYLLKGTWVSLVRLLFMLNLTVVFARYIKMPALPSPLPPLPLIPDIQFRLSF